MAKEGFDIETGMPVYLTTGERFGTVLDIAGFGAAKVEQVSADGSIELVIQTKNGSGYFNVDREDVAGAGSAKLTVPFHGIQDIVPGRGVVLNDTIVEQLERQWDPRPVSVVPASKRRGWWPKWM